jgi:hypothetical protein
MIDIAVPRINTVTPESNNLSFTSLYRIRSNEGIIIIESRKFNTKIFVTITERTIIFKYIRFSIPSPFLKIENVIT